MLKKQFYSHFNKSKDLILPLEEYHCKSTYALTISPSLQFHDNSPRLHQFLDNFLKNIKPLLAMNFKLYLEMSTLNQNYHFHGYANFNKDYEIALFYSNLPRIKELCSISLEKMFDCYWPVYVVKQRHLMKPFCVSLNEPYIQYKPSKTIYYKDKRS